jgi:cysteine desulfurase family protein (TIGR01976 family)
MTLNVLNVDEIRSKFPSLSQKIDGKPIIYLDNPAGTQVPKQVMDAVVDYYTRMNANQGGLFPSSIATDKMLQESRQIMADMLCAPSADEIVFGPNMTTLNFALSRALANTLPDDSEIVLTRMDHDANVSPWLAVARDRNFTVKWVDFDPEVGTLDMNSLESVLSEKTQVVAAVHASNALGTINPVAQIAEMAHSVNALFVMDAVQSAPHVPIDVSKIGCDILLCSAYKFFGPHIGIMWGRYDLLQELPVYKVRPSKNTPPFRWETGTASFETIAATAEAVCYLESLAGGEAVSVEGYEGRRARLKQAFANMQSYERQLAEKLVKGLQDIQGITIAGISDSEKFDQRIATVIFVKDGYSADEIAQHLANHNIFAWSGDYYAVEVMKRLGREDTGMVRVGAVHYNTMEEIDQLLNVLEAM